MKNLPDNHSPRANSWEKIIEKISFDDQVKGHIPNLALFEPDASSWDAITVKLEKKREVSFWPYFGIAATTIGIILIASVLWNKPTSLDLLYRDSLSLTSITAIDILVPLKKQVNQPDLNRTPNSSTVREKQSPRKKQIEIALISLEAPELEFIALDPEILIPDPIASDSDSIASPNTKTLHEVTISWGIKPSKFQVKTGFGKQDPSAINPQQTGSISRSRRIQIGQKN